MEPIPISNVSKKYHRGLEWLIEKIDHREDSIYEFDGFNVYVQDGILKIKYAPRDPLVSSSNLIISPWPRKIWIIFESSMMFKDKTIASIEDLTPEKRELYFKIANESTNFEIMELEEIEKAEINFRFKRSKYFHTYHFLSRKMPIRKNLFCQLTQLSQDCYLYEREGSSPRIARKYEISSLMKPIWDLRRESQMNDLISKTENLELKREMRKLWNWHCSKFQVLGNPLDRLIPEQERLVLEKIAKLGWLNGDILNVLLEELLPLGVKTVEQRDISIEIG